MSSIIAGVNRPVKVFCWLGWKQPSKDSSRTPRPGRPGTVTVVSAPCPNRGTGEGEGEPAEGDDHPRRRAGQPPLGIQPGRTRRPLVRLRRVARRGASHRGHHPNSFEHQAVRAVGSGRLIGQAIAIQRSEQEVTGAVPGEDAAGAVGAVRRGREAEHPHRRTHRTESGGRTAPVRFVGVGLALTDRDVLTPGHQPGARPTDRHPRVELSDGSGGRGQLHHIGGLGSDGRTRGRLVPRPSRAGPHRGGEQLAGAGMRQRRLGCLRGATHHLLPRSTVHRYHETPRSSASGRDRCRTIDLQAFRCSGGGAGRSG